MWGIFVSVRRTPCPASSANCTAGYAEIGSGFSFSFRQKPRAIRSCRRLCETHKTPPKQFVFAWVSPQAAFSFPKIKFSNGLYCSWALDRTESVLFGNPKWDLAMCDFVYLGASCASTFDF